MLPPDEVLHAAWVVLGLLLAAGTGVALAVALRVRGRAALAVAALVLGAASVITALESLSLAHLLTVAGMLVAQTLLAGGAVMAWRRAGRPRPPRLGLGRRALVAAVRDQPALSVLVVAAGAALAVQLFMGLAVAPNEPDSLLYHLPRVAYVLQNHSALQFAPIVPGDPATGEPPNAELLVTWLVGLAGSDRVVALPQWLALCGLGAAIFSGARMLGFGRPAAALAAGLFATMPAPLLQATTPQNDLVVSLFVAAAALFAVRGLRDRCRGDLAVAAAAYGLAVGTKPSALLLAPSLALVLAAAAWRWRPPRRTLAAAAGYAIAGVAALGAFNYVQSLAHTSSLTGGADRSVKRDYVRSNPVTAAGRVAWWSFVEVPGLPRVGFLERALGGVRRGLFDDAHGSYFGPPAQAVKTDVDEDANGFGLVGLVFLAPLLALALLAPRAPPEQRVLAGAAVLYLALIAGLIGWGPDVGRQLLAGMVLATPLLARAWGHPWLRRVAVGLALAGAVPVLVANPSKPLLKGGESSILSRDRRAQQLVWFEQEAPVLRSLDRRVGPRAPLGFLLNRDFTTSDWPVYPFFGLDLQRRVVPLSPGELTRAGIRRRQLSGVIVVPAKCREPGCQVRIAGLRQVDLGGGVLLVLPD